MHDKLREILHGDRLHFKVYKLICFVETSEVWLVFRMENRLENPGEIERR